MAWWYVASKKLKEELYKSRDLFHRVPVVSTNIMAVEEEELAEESKEEKKEEDTGVYANMAREVNEAKEAPPEEGV